VSTHDGSNEQGTTGYGEVIHIIANVI
jgi:hypothetical protein